MSFTRTTALCNTMPNKIYVHTFSFYNLNGKVVLEVTRASEFKTKIICVTGFVQNNFCNLMVRIRKISDKNLEHAAEKYLLQIFKKKLKNYLFIFSMIMYKLYIIIVCVFSDCFLILSK